MPTDLSYKPSFLLAGLAIFGINIICWLAALFIAPADALQGEYYRIIYVHVPSALSAFGAAAALGIFSVITLARHQVRWVNPARASVEVGLLFTVLTLVSGSIWGRPVWGTWWTWDARLTTTLLLALMNAGYLLLFLSIDDSRVRAKVCAVFGIMIFLDVPIIYKSVSWWRTLHQPPTLLRSGGSTMDPDMKTILLSCCFSMLVFSWWLIAARARNLNALTELESRVRQ